MPLLYGVGGKMGDIADMMLDGTLDSVTGEYLGDPCGYPRTTTKINKPKSKKTHKCPICKKLYRGEQGLKQHMKDKH